MLTLCGLLLIWCQDQVFLTEEQALQSVFRNGEITSRVILELTDQQKKAVEAVLKRTIDARWTVYVGLDKSSHKPVGYAVILDEIGKYQPITFIVGVDTLGKVIDVSIMIYREPVGSDVNKEWWLTQFKNKTEKDPIKRDKDIMKINGATMSCDGVCAGVRKVTAILTEGIIKVPGAAEKLLQDSKGKEPIRIQKYVMGSLCTIEAYSDDEAKARDAIERAFDEIKALDRVLSNYDETSELSKINKTGGGKIGAEMAEFLALSLKMSAATDGAFDITIGPAVQAWGFYDHKFRVPTADELKKLCERVGYHNIEFDATKSEVKLKKPGMMLDPGAIGKGMAVDRAVAVLTKAGIVSAFIDFGSSMHAIGNPPGKAIWTIGLRNPLDPTRLLGVITLKDQALSTSGRYEKLFEENGQVYTHILNPRTCDSVITMAGTTVVAKSGAEADALSTAFFVLGVGKSLELAKTLGVEAALVRVDKELRIEATEGFRKLFAEAK